MPMQPHNYTASLQGFADAVLAGDSAVLPYTNNYRTGHASALRNAYPLVCSTLGATTFAALAQVYVTHYPPARWDLNLYGEQFPELLQAQEQGGRASEIDWRLTAATARIEYAITQAYYAEDALTHGTAPALLAATPGVKAPHLTTDLQQQHPFADIEADMVLTQAIRIWREGVRVKIDNCAPLATQAGDSG